MSSGTIVAKGNRWSWWPPYRGTSCYT